MLDILAARWCHVGQVICFFAFVRVDYVAHQQFYIGVIGRVSHVLAKSQMLNRPDNMEHQDNKNRSRD
jgi:hypothetical protein